MSDEPPAWPDDDEDPFGPVSNETKDAKTNPTEEEMVESEHDEEQEDHLEQSSNAEETQFRGVCPYEWPRY